MRACLINRISTEHYHDPFLVVVVEDDHLVESHPVESPDILLLDLFEEFSQFVVKDLFGTEQYVLHTVLQPSEQALDGDE